MEGAGMQTQKSRTMASETSTLPKAVGVEAEDPIPQAAARSSDSRESSKTGRSGKTPIEELLTSLNLREDEEEDIVLEEDLEELAAKARWMALARVFMAKTFSHGALYGDMRAAWNLAKEVEFRAIEDNLFSMQFKCLADWERVMHGGPWIFRGSPVLMAEYDGWADTNSVDLNWFPAWVHVLDLKEKMRTGSIAKQLSKRAGTLQYEKMPDICGVCGFVGHVQKECGDGVWPDEKIIYPLTLIVPAFRRDAAWRQSNGGRGGRGTERGRGRGRGGRGGGPGLSKPKSYEEDDDLSSTASSPVKIGGRAERTSSSKRRLDMGEVKEPYVHPDGTLLLTYNPTTEPMLTDDKVGAAVEEVDDSDRNSLSSRDKVSECGETTGCPGIMTRPQLRRRLLGCEESINCLYQMSSEVENMGTENVVEAASQADVPMDVDNAIVVAGEVKATEVAQASGGAGEEISADGGWRLCGATGALPASFSF
ncbi:hypothetical protein ACQ4PT_016041 [Festuca glaucescens]